MAVVVCTEMAFSSLFAAAGGCFRLASPFMPAQPKAIINAQITMRMITCFFCRFSSCLIPIFPTFKLSGKMFFFENLFDLLEHLAPLL